MNLRRETIYLDFLEVVSESGFLFLISCQINFIGLVVMTLNLFTGGGNGYLKVRKSAKQFVVSSILPKNVETHYPELPLYSE
mgnify:CR=1 FL=1